jgi:hypothetical protein
MGVKLWGASPLYENEDLQEGSIPTVTPIEQVRDEGKLLRADWHDRAGGVAGVSGVGGGAGQKGSYSQTHRHAATLDTKPAANSYSGGIPTRRSSNHYQYATSLFVKRLLGKSNSSFI